MNSISSVGCFHLSQSKWSRGLQYLNLGKFNSFSSNSLKYTSSQNYAGNNRIEDKGCKQLAKGEWEQLKELSICNTVEIKGIMELERRESNIYPKEI